MSTGLDVHLKDFSGRDFGGSYAVRGIMLTEGRLAVDLEYCGGRGKKRLTTAWLHIDEELVRDMAKALTPPPS